MRNPLLPATNALSLSARLAMSMREKRELRHVLNAKPDTSASKVCLSRFLLLQMVK